MKSNILPIAPVPVTITIVVLCDTSVLVKQRGEDVIFPSGYLVPVRETCQDRASFILKEALCDFQQVQDRWTPVDIRSQSRINEDGLFTLDIGYMTMLDTHDLPYTCSEEYKWQQVNLDSEIFPAILGLDHLELWRATSGLFSFLHG